jgi:NAD(P)-dependent dehydrogenase (short-subunit alcohol dehydrogenase family)
VQNIFDVSGRTALVTGASSGLGRQFAATLAGAGARVALAARRMDKLEALARSLTADGARVHVVTMDVCDADSVAAAFADVESVLGTATVVVNNAGVAIGTPALEVTEADWDRVVDTNLKGAWLVAREAARRMVAAGVGGSLINIASIVGFRVTKGATAYAAAKAGLAHLNGALALELARYDIRVNAIAPGYIDTEMTREFLATPAGEALVKRIPQRRVGEPRDLDGALLLLASDASRFMTGSVITVDGGHLQSTL